MHTTFCFFYTLFFVCLLAYLLDLMLLLLQSYVSMCIHFLWFFCVYIFALILYFLETVALYVYISHISISHFLIVIYLSMHIFVYTAFEVNCV